MDFDTMGLSSAQILIALVQIFASVATSHGENVEIFAKAVVYEEYFKPIWKQEKASVITRKRRDINNPIKINFINKSGREVRVYQVGVFGFLVTPKFDLRPNEPRALEVSSGSVWEVRDLDTGIYMLTNGEQRFSVRGKSSNAFLDLRIKRPYFLERKLKKFHPVPEKYLRVMVVADETVSNYHGKEQSKKLIRTIMSSVSKIFQDESLGVKINIILTKLFLLKDIPSTFRIYENDPDASIRNACSYAAKLAHESGENSHNFVAIITRKSIGPSGYAAMYTMCSPRSCSLIKENGYNTAYVIAHEAGHALGIDHDGEDGDCEDDKLEGSLMAPKVYSKNEKYHWSFCSKRSLYENIKYFPCLDKKLSEYEVNEVDKFYKLPGEISTKTDQCQRAFSFTSTGCFVSYEACQYLWCRRNVWSGCAAFPLTSPLEGTDCDSNKWCIKGKCVDKNKEEAPIHGSWGTWTIFGACKGLCGAGIRTRTRLCDNPVPKRGGRKCQGKSADVKACALKKCWPDFSKIRERDLKCRKLGKSWGEYSIEMQDVNLTSARISCSFEDGSCGWGNDVRNRQKWLLNSGPTKSSKTGPSNDNTLGTSQGKYAYFEASWINPYYEPLEGSRSKLISQPIWIKTVCFSFHYHMYGGNMGSLKLHKMNEKRELEEIWSKIGEQGNEWYRDEITVTSTEKYQLVFEAIRGKGYRSDIAIDDIKIFAGICINGGEANPPPCSIKCISVKEKMIKEVDLEDGFPCHLNDLLDVCYQGKCKSVGCDFTIGSTKKFDDCGVCAGDGKSCKAVKTRKNIEATRTFVEVYLVPEGSENVEIKMKKHQWLLPGIYIDDGNATNVFNTDGNQWPYGNYTTKENVFIYKEGFSDLTVTIPKLVNQGCRVMVYNPLAREAAGQKPKADINLNARLPLTVDYDQFEFNVKSWTPCTKSCDGGVQHPVLSCVEKNTEKVITDLYCSDIIGAGLELKRACNIQKCLERYTWTLGAWGACSATCGLSSQGRRVKCRDRRVNRIVEDEKCPRPKPPETQSCFAGPCMDHSFFTTSWGQCSRACGKGFQRRKVRCAINNQTSNEQPFITCPGRLPVTAKPCYHEPCNTYQWVSRGLTHCSETCGGGLRIRTSNCYHVESSSIVFDSLCPKPRPPSIEYCNRYVCN